MSRIRILIVDDQLRARRSLTALLAIEPYVEQIYSAAGGSQALWLIEQSMPDLILIDARMPEMDGTEVTREIKRRWPHIKIVVLSMYVDYMNEALDAGADAFVSKGEPPDRLLTLIQNLVSTGAS